MSARDEYPFDMDDPFMQWTRLCDEIDRLRAEVERWKLIASEHERTA
jgi:hypothetical protein